MCGIDTTRVQKAVNLNLDVYAEFGDDDATACDTIKVNGRDKNGLCGRQEEPGQVSKHVSHLCGSYFLRLGLLRIGLVDLVLVVVVLVVVVLVEPGHGVHRLHKLVIRMAEVMDHDMTRDVPRGQPSEEPPLLG